MFLPPLPNCLLSPLSLLPYPLSHSFLDAHPRYCESAYNVPHRFLNFPSPPSPSVVPLVSPRLPFSQDGCRFAFIETALALLVAFAINVAVFCVSGSICNQPHPSPETKQQCEGITLNTAYFLLQVGGWADGRMGPTVGLQPQGLGE